MSDNMINISEGFQTSINIAYDLNDDNKIKSFIPTNSSIEVIEDVLLSTVNNSTQRSRILIGAYGRGKSHLILVLLSLLYRKERALFERLLNRLELTNYELYEFMYNYLDSDQRLLPVIVSGNSTSLTQSFLTALQRSLNQNELSDLMPETHFKAAISVIENWKKNYKGTYNQFVSLIDQPIEDYIIKLKEYNVASYDRFVEIYPTLTSGSVFNPFIGNDVVEIYEGVVDKLEAYGFNGVYIVYDEFSKYLESSISNTSISDIKLLQDLAEKCNRSGSKQIHLLLISHKDIANYIDDNLPKEKIDGWRGVSGRFIHQHLHNNFSQMYEIISQVILKNNSIWNSFMGLNKQGFEELAEKYAKNELLSSNNLSDVNEIIQGCYPLHPITMFLLPRISEKIAQNERTLFTFLSAEDKYTLRSFLEHNSEGFVQLTPDYLYDYFEPLLRKESYMTSTHQIYKLTNSILRKVEKQELESRIIKTIALIYIVEQFEKLPPTVDVIVDTYSSQFGGTEIINNALIELIQKQCIVYLRRSNQYLKLKETTGVDIPSEIRNAVENIKVNKNSFEILNEVNLENYLYPTQYNDENEIVRYFDFKFINSDMFWNMKDWSSLLLLTQADGIVIGVLPKSQEDLNEIKKMLQDKLVNSEQIIFVIPKKYNSVDDAIYEYQALLNLRNLSQEDEQLKSEYEIYIEDLEEVVRNFVSDYIRPEKKNSIYFYEGNGKNLYRRAQLSGLLSSICSKLYSATPIVNNELINKNELSTVTLNSRTRIVNGLLEADVDLNLGLGGNSQDLSILRSVLINPGILIEKNGKIEVCLDVEDHLLNDVLSKIEQFILHPTNEIKQRFIDLYEILTQPKYHFGLKRGIIPLYLTAVLLTCRSHIAITRQGREEKITADLINSINDHPENYEIVVENWNSDKTQYVEKIEKLFSQFINEREKSYNNFNYLMYAMNRWYMSLPRYVKEMNSVYFGFVSETPFKKLDKSSKKYINSLKRVDNNPREYLFEEIFSIFGMKEFDLSVLQNLKKTKQIFDTAMESLLANLIEDVKNIFSNHNNPKSSMTSILIDWYESLEESTKNHLFPNGENRALEVICGVTNDETSFVKKLAKVVTGLRIEDWNDATIQEFTNSLSKIRFIIEEYDTHVDDVNNNENSEIGNNYTISYVNSQGDMITKTFESCEYGIRANLLKNEIETALDEMGQSISEQEKRQVLIELIKKLC